MILREKIIQKKTMKHKIADSVRIIVLSGNVRTDANVKIAISIALIIIVILSFKLSRFLDDFLKELESLNNVIRKTEGEEREFWEQRKKKLWRSLLTFHRFED